MDQVDLRSAAFTLQLLRSLPDSEWERELAEVLCIQRKLAREAVVSELEEWASEQREDARRLCRMLEPTETFQHGMATGMDILLVRVRRLIRRLRGVPERD